MAYLNVDATGNELHVTEESVEKTALTTAHTTHNGC